MLSLGVETWSKSLHKVGFTRKARVLLGLQGPWRLAPGLRKTFFCAFQKPCGLSPLAQIKCSRTQTFRKTSGTHSGEFWNPSGVQTLLSHTSIFISEPFRSSSSRLGSHPGLRTTFGNYVHVFPITLASSNLKCVDPTGSGDM